MCRSPAGSVGRLARSSTVPGSSCTPCQRISRCPLDADLDDECREATQRRDVPERGVHRVALGVVQRQPGRPQRLGLGLRQRGNVEIVEDAAGVENSGPAAGSACRKKSRVASPRCSASTMLWNTVSTMTLACFFVRSATWATSSTPASSRLGSRGVDSSGGCQHLSWTNGGGGSWTIGPRRLRSRNICNNSNLRLHVRFPSTCPSFSTGCQRAKNTVDGRIGILRSAFFVFSRACVVVDPSERSAPVANLFVSTPSLIVCASSSLGCLVHRTEFHRGHVEIEQCIALTSLT